ncbi:MAG: hypothetical protein WBL25_07810, partial [Anaerolineales bacterium]
LYTQIVNLSGFLAPLYMIGLSSFWMIFYITLNYNLRYLISTTKARLGSLNYQHFTIDHTVKGA